MIRNVEPSDDNFHFNIINNLHECYPLILRFYKELNLRTKLFDEIKYLINNGQDKVHVALDCYAHIYSIFEQYSDIKDMLLSTIYGDNHYYAFEMLYDKISIP